MNDFVVTTLVVFGFWAFILIKTHREKKKQNARLQVLRERVARQEKIQANQHELYVTFTMHHGRRVEKYYCNKCGEEGYLNAVFTPCPGVRKSDCRIQFTTTGNPFNKTQHFYCDTHGKYSPNAKHCTWANYKESSDE